MSEPLVTLRDVDALTADLCVVCLAEPPIPDDGFPVGPACIERIGRIAGDPCLASVGELAMLAEVHADVATISSSIQRGMFWRWTSAWPDVGEFNLLIDADMVRRVQARLDAIRYGRL